MKSFLKFSILLFIFSTLIIAQEKTRSQKIEELKKLTSQLEQIQNQIQQIESQRDEIAVELLGATEIDAEIAKKSGAKAYRLFPDGLMDNLFYAPDEAGFSVYSFTDISNYYFAPRLEYKNNSLEFVQAEKSIGFIANLGVISFEAIDEKTSEVTALAKYQPPTDFKDAKSEFATDKFTFKNKVSIAVGNTYLARAVSYKEGDGIFALKIHRKDTDGSIILFVKLIKKFDTQSKNIDSTNREDSKVIPNYQAIQAIQNALWQKGFTDVIVDGSTVPMTLRGTFPKGKLAEVVQTAQEANGGKPIRNEMTEQ